MIHLSVSDKIFCPSVIWDRQTGFSHLPSNRRHATWTSDAYPGPASYRTPSHKTRRSSEGSLRGPF